MQHEKTSLNTPLTLSKFTNWLKVQPYLSGGFLFGSYARGDQDFRSDLDIALIANQELKPAFFEQELRKFWGVELQIINYRKRKKSFTIYLKHLTKIDLHFSTDRNDLARNFRGSIIPQTQLFNIILFDKSGNLFEFLNQQYNKTKKTDSDQTINSLTNNFLIEFEACSRLHAKSDAYRFYFNYNIALHTAVQLRSMANGNKAFPYSPRFFTQTILKKENQFDFHETAGTMCLNEGNNQKRMLLDFFYESIGILNSENLPKLKQFCESVFERDYFWNFRDHSIHSSILRPDFLYRSSSLSLCQNQAKAIELLTKNKITTIIDLRAPREVSEHPYPKDFLTKFNYLNAPFDPWNQPKWFEANHHQGNNRTIAYRFFLIACQSFFKQTVAAILKSEGNIVIHCFAGKDRTGLLIGALQLLAGVSKKHTIIDYMASGADTEETYFKMLFNEVEKQGGIEAFFNYQGIDKESVRQLKQKLRTP